MLVVHQRRNQHFFGQVAGELGSERAGDDRRVLDQVGYLVQ
jgi:hypothetical protein